jgi:hypothetical protein
MGRFLGVRPAEYADCEGAGNGGKRARMTVTSLPGLLLIAIGLIDGAAALLWPEAGALLAIATILVLGGVSLLAGGARAVRPVRAGAILLAAMGGAAVLGAAAVWPLGLTWTAAGLHPDIAMRAAALLTGNIFGLIGAARFLGRPTVLDALAGAGLRPWPADLPAKIGAGLSFLAALLLWLTLHGQSAALATSLALQQLGPVFQYQLLWVSRENDGALKQVTGTVAAWNDREVRLVIIHWREK